MFLDKKNREKGWVRKNSRLTNDNINDNIPINPTRIVYYIGIWKGDYYEKEGEKA